MLVCERTYIMYATSIADAMSELSYAKSENGGKVFLTVKCKIISCLVWL